MKRFIYSFLTVMCLSTLGHAQTIQGRFCLEYYPQPLVETYVDSLVSYLTKELSDGENPLDSITEDYIEHFSSLATRKSKCVYFTSDTILIHEKVDDELTNAYMILPALNQLISRDQGGLVRQNYFLEPSAELGYFDYTITTDENDTKLIEGFLCYRLDLVESFYAPNETSPREKKYTLYVTDDIELPGGFVLGNNLNRIIGCPLEIQEPLNSKVSIAYRAKGLRLNLPDGVFGSL
ncbi:MAG: hypothetical protein HKN76_21035 [Saprospiraceae bacterium]|nr:hypothetical protein [Saprospiraceae bacterium]